MAAALADGARQALRAAGARHGAEIDLRLAEAGVLRAMMMSHIMASSQPPPRAKPATAAMIGFLRCATRAQGAMKSVPVAPRSPGRPSP